MGTWPVKRQISNLVRKTRRTATGSDPHQLREALEKTVWQYVNTKVPTEDAAWDILREIGKGAKQLPPPGESLFTIRSTREAQSAATASHRFLATWLMAVAWQQLRPQ